MTLGINRGKTAALSALADAGGTASTSQLVEVTAVGKQHLLRLLKELEAEGYVHGRPSRDRGPGIPLTWTIDTAALLRDLHRLAEAWTPKPSTDSREHEG